jgi:hypothetical protein
LSPAKNRTKRLDSEEAQKEALKALGAIERHDFRIIPFDPSMPQIERGIGQYLWG